jgi:hypothetical protein
MAFKQPCDTAKHAFCLLLDNQVVMTCCKERAEYLELKCNHKVEVVYSVRDAIIPMPNCGLGCIKLEHQGVIS